MQICKWFCRLPMSSTGFKPPKRFGRHFLGGGCHVDGRRRCEGVGNPPCLTGDLFDKLVHLRQYSEKIAARLVNRVVSAVKYMHDEGVVHRDIKPENVMLREDTSGISFRRKSEDAPSQPHLLARLANVTLVDFGFAKFCAPGSETLTDCCGTIEYMAPEIILCWMSKRCVGHALRWRAGVA